MSNPAKAYLFARLSEHGNWFQVVIGVGPSHEMQVVYDFITNPAIAAALARRGNITA